MPSKQQRPREKSRRSHHVDSSDDEQTALLKSQLANISLKLKDIIGDGNCMFRALADQYDGSPDTHKHHRAAVCSHLLNNRSYFEPFLSGKDASSFDWHVRNMSEDGTYGGNMELVAFAQPMKVDICVYWGGGCYIVRGNDNPSDRLLHIAYHSWEHYSSVRNEGGPMTGLPDIHISPPATDKPKVKADKRLPTSLEKMVMRLTDCDDIVKVRRVLQKVKGNANKAIDSILEEVNGTDGVQVGSAAPNCPRTESRCKTAAEGK
ncbi:OTU domain-containing protein 3 [Rhizophlyctis rosea]|nr:OTU domain-containing protein 3 [Rhizophlyctis rosea]